MHKNTNDSKLLSLSGIRDNDTRGRVADFLKSELQAGTRLSVVSAFFTIYAHHALKTELADIGHLDFLFGEPRFVKNLDPEEAEAKAFLVDASGLQLGNVLPQKPIARECADWIRDKVTIRSVRQSNFLHGKLYHLAQDGRDAALLGSSNFTVRGLGLAPHGNNLELNLVVDSNRDRADLKAWFDELWDNPELVVDVTEKVLLYLEQVYGNQTPEFVYYKTLFHLFEAFLDAAGKTDSELEQTSLFETEIWKRLFAFQKDGVKGAINKMLAHNGCILADSVGLGKTYEALAVIKYFELRNERVLVLCPKKLRENWTVYTRNDRLNPFVTDRFRYDVLAHTDLSRVQGSSGNLDLATLNWSNYDLVVIDESHNFRNNTPGRRDADGNLIRRSRYQRLLEDVLQSGVRTKVLLLSATPVNSDLKDLRNQIYFITEGQDNTFQESLGIASLKETLRQAQGRFTHWTKQPATRRNTGSLLNELGAEFFRLLDGLTIARARRHIRQHYAHEMERLGPFPERRKPITQTPEIDLQGRFLSYDKLSEEIEGYTLSLFNPSRFVLPEHRAAYEHKVGNYTQPLREQFLIGMMKVNFLKRLESAVPSFALTMQRTMEKIEALEQRLKAFQSFREDHPELDFESLPPDEVEDEELREALEVGKKLVFKTAHLDVDAWLEALHADKQQLHGLYLQAQDVTPARDAKLAELKRLIADKARNPTINRLGEPNRKLLVFTAFADTATYLYDHLSKWALTEHGLHTGLVCGSDRNRTNFAPEGSRPTTEFNHLLINFSPHSKNRAQIPGMPQHGEIDLLIATDCISEGQNLQDCDCLINYDIHWNPVRIIQRFGRIDRLGSQNPAVQLVNFWPTPHLDRYLSLKHRVEARMALVDIAATLEDNLLKPEEAEDLVRHELSYRDQQLLKLKEEILDVEDLSGAADLTEFNLDDFRLDLLKYLEANRSRLEDTPLGLSAVVPPHPEAPVIQPGVVFCLRQKSAEVASEPSGSRPVNPLHPYFLVYVLDDGNVRLGFTQPKQILTIFRELCLGKEQAYEQLCDLFDHHTQNGTELSHYDSLLQKAVAAIMATFQKRLVGELQSRRGFKIPKQEERVRDITDFELVTWLVVLKEVE